MILLFLLILIFSPINLSSSTIVNISLTKGIFLRIVLCERIVAAKIGRVAFFDPEIEIFPFNPILPLIISLCINKDFI